MYEPTGVIFIQTTTENLIIQYITDLMILVVGIEKRR